MLSFTSTAWFSNFLARQVVRKLGAPVFIASVADERHHSDVEDVATPALRKQPPATNLGSAG